MFACRSIKINTNFCLCLSFLVVAVWNTWQVGKVRKLIKMNVYFFFFFSMTLNSHVNTANKTSQKRRLCYLQTIDIYLEKIIQSAVSFTKSEKLNKNDDQKIIV